MATDQYKYQKLETPNTIRLLKILPELENGLIVCALQHFTEKEVPPYDALSYFWGVKTQTRRIFLKGANGTKLHYQDLHENLWAFLDQMYTMKKTDCYYWTDFLCLDQTSKPEIQQQVPRMGQIYSEASRTISWLGRATDLSPIELKNLEGHMDRLKDWSLTTGKDAEAFFASLPPKDKSPTYNDTYIPRGELNRFRVGKIYHPTNTILEFPYWTRLWVVQEVALSKRIDIVFGTRSIDLDSFFVAYKLFVSSARTDNNKRVAIEARKTFPNISIDRLLEWGAACDSSEQLDRVYGLLGLVRQGRQEASYLDCLIADYKKPATNLFWELVFGLDLHRKIAAEKQTDHANRMAIGPHAETGIWKRTLHNLAQSLSCRMDDEKSLETFISSSETSSEHKVWALALLQVVRIYRAMGSLLGRRFLEAWLGQEHSTFNELYTKVWDSLLSSCQTTAKSESQQDHILKSMRLGFFELKEGDFGRRHLGEWACLEVDQKSLGLVSKTAYSKRVLVYSTFDDKEWKHFKKYGCALHRSEEDGQPLRNCYKSPLVLDMKHMGWKLTFLPSTDAANLDSYSDTLNTAERGEELGNLFFQFRAGWFHGLVLQVTRRCRFFL